MESSLSMAALITLLSVSAALKIKPGKTNVFRGITIPSAIKSRISICRGMVETFIRHANPSGQTEIPDVEDEAVLPKLISALVILKGQTGAMDNHLNANGYFIAKNWVSTSGCKARELSNHFGEANLEAVTSSGTRFLSTRVLIHPECRQDPQTDVALVHVREVVSMTSLTNFVHPVKLAHPKDSDGPYLFTLGLMEQRGSDIPRVWSKMNWGKQGIRFGVSVVARGVPKSSTSSAGAPVFRKDSALCGHIAYDPIKNRIRDGTNRTSIVKTDMWIRKYADDSVVLD